ncbi:MAG: DUF3088 family protein [Alphaproteobacteria bacterium]|jgi:hypothetical protein|nr:DUF3088 family protein [Alphaproteobacteria bacterium]
MAKDILFILPPAFEDPALEGRWFCPDGALVYGALAANPHWADQIEIRSIAFPRPRPEVAALVGEENQGLPLLLFADPATAPADAKRRDGRAFLQGGLAICAALAARYGGAGPHP